MLGGLLRKLPGGLPVLGVEEEGDGAVPLELSTVTPSAMVDGNGEMASPATGKKGKRVRSTRQRVEHYGEEEWEARAHRRRRIEADCSGGTVPGRMENLKLPTACEVSGD